MEVHLVCMHVCRCRYRIIYIPYLELGRLPLHSPISYSRLPGYAEGPHPVATPQHTQAVICTIRLLRLRGASRQSHLTIRFAVSWIMTALTCISWRERESMRTYSLGCGSPLQAKEVEREKGGGTVRSRNAQMHFASCAMYATQTWTRGVYADSSCRHPL